MKNIAIGARWVLAGRDTTAATVQTVLAKILIVAISVCNGILTARFLQPQGRGELTAISIGFQFLAYTISLGLPTSLRYQLKFHPQKKSELFSASFVIGMTLGVVTAVTGIIFIPQLIPHYPVKVIRSAQWLMLVTPLILLSETFAAALEASDEFAFANQIRYLQPLITLFALATFVFFQALTPFTAALAYALPRLPLFIWMLKRLWKRFHTCWFSLGNAYKLLISYGLRAYGIDLLSLLTEKVDQVLVANLLSPTSMGLYAVALSMSRMLNLFQLSIIPVLLAKAAARPINEVVAIVGRAVRVSVAFTVLATIAIILLIPVLLQTLYGSEYLEAVAVFRILALEVVLSGTTWVLAVALMVLNRPGTVTVIQCLSLVLLVLLMLILVPLFGLEGAGLALLCSAVIRLLSVTLSFPLILKVRLPNLLITREDLQTIKQIFQQALNRV